MKKPVKETSEQIQLNKEWGEVRIRLAAFPAHFNPEKTIELLDLCRASPEIRQWKPYITLGRVGLREEISDEQLYAEGKQAITDNSPCFYFSEGHYTVAGYDNRDKWHFTTSVEAVSFLRQHLPGVPHKQAPNWRELSDEGA